MGLELLAGQLVSQALARILTMSEDDSVFAALRADALRPPAQGSQRR